MFSWQRLMVLLLFLHNPSETTFLQITMLINTTYESDVVIHLHFKSLKKLCKIIEIQ